MTTFLRLLADKDKATNLLDSCTALRVGDADARVFQLAPESFRAVPGAPFAYWVSDSIRSLFKELPALASANRRACFGLSTKDDTRFLRLNWEIPATRGVWLPFVKGGAYSKFYADPYLLLDWEDDGLRLKAFADHRTRQIFGVGSWSRWINNWNEYLRPGLTWPRRTTSGISLRVMPQGCIFADKGPAAFVANDAPGDLLALCAMTNSHAFGLLVSLQLAAADAAARSYEVGVIQKTPIPDFSSEQRARLGALARRAWSLKRTLDTTEETSHAFVLPAALRLRMGDCDPPAIEIELARIQAEIDATAFDLYGFSDADRAATHASQGEANEGNAELSVDDEGDDEDSAAAPIAQTDGLISWAVGVAFGRFDWRLATGERAAPPEPEPFDPLPEKSPGMLPDGALPFHQNAGILADDQDHPQDLARLVEQVLETVDVPGTEDVRRWLQKDFFTFHLQRYSKSRRKAPIYWPLATTSGSYTLWLNYSNLSDQILFTAVNDFVDPKLEEVRKQLQGLRDKGAGRSKQDEKSLEALASLEHELADLRDSLLEVAPNYRPNHDDGVQITAAPLWKLFRHKPWQKALKDTWAKLEKGDYDWAHLAMNYWPERVREKCVTDKSLAIAHNLEHLYIEPEPKPAKARGRKNAGSTE